MTHAIKPLTKWERIEAALNGGDVDRVPISLWKHYHLRDRAPRQLAEVSLALHRQFDTDLIKLTPSGLYPIQDWGATIKFGRDDNTGPLAVSPVITAAGQWPGLPRLDVHKGVLQRELETIHTVAAGLEGVVPFMMSIFSPLTIAHRLAGDALFEHLRQTPTQLHAGLRVIRDVTIEYAQAVLEAGAPGFFFATQLASADVLTAAEYKEFGVAYDLPVLESLVGKSRVTMLHVCRKNIFLDLVAGYPVDVINWAAYNSGTSIADARRITDKPLASGLSLETLARGTEADVIRQVQEAIAVAGHKGFIIAPECVIRGSSPDANLAAARRAVDTL